MDAVRPSETFVSYLNSTLRHSTEDLESPLRLQIQETSIEIFHTFLVSVPELRSKPTATAIMQD